MSDQKFTSLPQNKNDLEYNKYGLDGDGKVSVRVVGATVNADGIEITDTLLREVQRMLVVMDEMNERLMMIVNHMRIVTSTNEDKGDIF